jgi:hypothetical protein
MLSSSPPKRNRQADDAVGPRATSSPLVAVSSPGPKIGRNQGPSPWNGSPAHHWWSEESPRETVGHSEEAPRWEEAPNSPVGRGVSIPSHRSLPHHRGLLMFFYSAELQTLRPYGMKMGAPSERRRQVDSRPAYPVPIHFP